MDVLATRNPGSLVLLVTNHQVPLAVIETEQVEIRLSHGRVDGDGKSRVSKREAD